MAMSTKLFLVHDSEAEWLDDPDHTYPPGFALSGEPVDQPDCSVSREVVAQSDNPLSREAAAKPERSQSMAEPTYKVDIPLSREAATKLERSQSMAHHRCKAETSDQGASALPRRSPCLMQASYEASLSRSTLEQLKKLAEEVTPDEQESQ
eukprot:TRINITY_DN66375_c0_g1_i1.p1 TRINITY_DN66375_c0_g1~~TRINITY_DN66375_c0_g1_i1.p1  ORF type:complete len:151 (-),score=26.76 TRINITY_DN66375_c0_g1_i1:129-581(-)